jgi:DNA replication protein DnaD
MIDWLNNGVTTLEHIASRDEEWNANKERKRKNKAPGDKSPKPPRTPSGKYEKFYL